MNPSPNNWHSGCALLDRQEGGNIKKTKNKKKEICTGYVREKVDWWLYVISDHIISIIRDNDIYIHLDKVSMITRQGALVGWNE